MDYVKILEAAVSGDVNMLEKARKVLEEAAQFNLAQLLLELVKILSDESISAPIRQAAGLYFKNLLVSKDPVQLLTLKQRWLSVESNTRDQIKFLVLKALTNEISRPSSSAQCLSSIACAELPQNQWIEVVNILKDNVIGTSPDKTKETSLEAIGYICQDIEPIYLIGFSGPILTAIMYGLREDEKNLNVKYAAILALLNSLDFAHSNFQNDTERNYIMETVCLNTRYHDSKIKIVALQCLVKIVGLYYKFMEVYMESALFSITIEAMKSGINEISLQGIEFWSTICDEEYNILAEDVYDNSTICKYYAKGALPYVVPILLEALINQEETDDEDEWNPRKAAGVSLMLFANICGAHIFPLITPFFTNFINDQRWQFRDAAAISIGSVFEGPEIGHLHPLAVEYMPVLISVLINDINNGVKDSAAWALGRMIQQAPSAAFVSSIFPELLKALSKCLSEEPNVAANICWAICYLASGAYEIAFENNQNEESLSTCMLSSSFKPIVTALLVTADRKDASQSQLRGASYSALMDMIKNSASDCYNYVVELSLDITDRLSRSVQFESQITNASDKTQLNDIQSLLCATIQAIIRTLKKNDVLSISDQLMKILFHMLISSKSAGVQEDIFMTIGIIIETTGSNCQKYLDELLPLLEAGLRAINECQVCISAVGIVGDLTRSLGLAILPFSQNFLTFLTELLASKNVHHSIKPHVITVIGDIALAIGQNFIQFMNNIIGSINEAAVACSRPAPSPDLIDIYIELRSACLDCYTGIVQGLKGPNNRSKTQSLSSSYSSQDQHLQLLAPHVCVMVNLIEFVAESTDRTDDLVCSACGLIGDIASTFGTSCITLLEKNSIASLLEKARQSKCHKTRTVCNWALTEIKLLSNQTAKFG